MKKQAEATIPREEELKEIWKFYNSICELPEHIGHVLSGTVLSLYSIPSWEKEIKEQGFETWLEENNPNEEISNVSPEHAKQGVISIFKEIFAYRLSKKDTELMGEKWDELHDSGKFIDWFATEYESLFEEWIENEFHNNLIGAIDYIEKKLTNGQFGMTFYYPISWETAVDLTSTIKKNSEEYKMWMETKAMERREYDKGATDKTSALYEHFRFYYTLTERIFEAFFKMMQNESGELRQSDYRLIYNRLREKGIDRYVQQRYDEYRSLMPGTADLRFFYTPRAEEVYQILGKYINTGHRREETICYFQDLIDKVLPGLANRNQAVGFIRLLWLDDKHFSKSKKGEEMDTKLSPSSGTRQ